MSRPWIIYTRVSTDEQATEGHSLAAQRDTCAAMLKATGTTAVEVIEDGGYSAKNLDRPGVKRLLRMIERREIGGVIIWKIDRLTRRLRDLLDIVDLCERTGTAIRSVCEMLDTTTPMGRFFMSMLGGIAQLERETIAQRVKLGMQHRMAQGGYVGSHVPAGCLVEGEAGKRRLVADPRWRDVAATAWSMVAKGATLAETVRWLAAQGMPAPKHKGKAATEAAWNTNNLHYWLTNPKMVGLLVDRVTFDAVGATLKSRWSPQAAERGGFRPGETERVWPFRGLIRCAACGEMMVGTNAKGRGGREYFYLRCANRGKAACSAPQLPADAYERALLEAVVEKVRDKREILAWFAEERAKATALAQAQAELLRQATMERDAAKTRIDNLLTLVADGGQVAAVVKERLQAEAQRAQEAEHRVRRLQGEMAAAGVAALDVEAAIEGIRAGVEALLDAPPAVQAKGLGMLIREVRCSADRAEIDLRWSVAAVCMKDQNGGPDRITYEPTVTLGVRFAHHREGTGRRWVVTVAG